MATERVIMPELDESEQEKLKEMLVDWDNMKRAIKTLAWFGSVVGWLIGIGSGIIVFIQTWKQPGH